jgi:hypothetical protein
VQERIDGHGQVASPTCNVLNVSYEPHELGMNNGNSAKGFCVCLSVCGAEWKLTNLSPPDLKRLDPIVDRHCTWNEYCVGVNFQNLII